MLADVFGVDGGDALAHLLYEAEDFLGCEAVTC